jgi:hypothetical protein
METDHHFKDGQMLGVINAKFIDGQAYNCRVIAIDEVDKIAKLFFDFRTIFSKF